MPGTSFFCTLLWFVNIQQQSVTWDSPPLPRSPHLPSLLSPEQACLLHFCFETPTRDYSLPSPRLSSFLLTQEPHRPQVAGGTCLWNFLVGDTGKGRGCCGDSGLVIDMGPPAPHPTLGLRSGAAADVWVLSFKCGFQQDRTREGLNNPLRNLPVISSSHCLNCV